MAIRDITRYLEGTLDDLSIDFARKKQYEQTITRITLEKSQAIRDHNKLFQLKGNSREIKSIRKIIREVIDDVYTVSNAKTILRKHKFQIETSIAKARARSKTEFYRSRGQGSTNLVVVDASSSGIRIAFVYSHQAGKGTAFYGGNNVIRDFKVQILEKVKEHYKKILGKEAPSTANSKNLYRTHGRTAGANDNAALHTTVALGSVVENLLSLKDLNRDVPGITGIPTKIIDRYLKELLAYFTIRRKRFESVEEFRDHFIFDMELRERDINAKMREADVPGIEEILPKVAEKLLKIFGKDYEGSRKPTKVLTGKGQKAIIDGVLDRPRDAKGRFIKVTKAKSNEKDSKTSQIVKGSKTLAKGKYSKKTTAGKPAKAPRGKAVARTQESAIKLRALLDRMLPKVVESKMQQPRLVYRTGRFAQSVRTENVVIGPRGGIHIDYTYMKYPYQTFEPGFAQGSKYRDPRSIIKESIREIAITLVGEKFMTIRRV